MRQLVPQRANRTPPMRQLVPQRANRTPPMRLQRQVVNQILQRTKKNQPPKRTKTKARKRRPKTRYLRTEDQNCFRISAGKQSTFWLLLLSLFETDLLEPGMDFEQEEECPGCVCENGQLNYTTYGRCIFGTKCAAERLVHFNPSEEGYGIAFQYPVTQENGNLDSILRLFPPPKMVSDFSAPESEGALIMEFFNTKQETHFSLTLTPRESGTALQIDMAISGSGSGPTTDGTGSETTTDQPEPETTIGSSSTGKITESTSKGNETSTTGDESTSKASEKPASTTAGGNSTEKPAESTPKMFIRRKRQSEFRSVQYFDRSALNSGRSYIPSKLQFKKNLQPNHH